MITYFNGEIAKMYGVEEAVLINEIRILGNIDRDSGLLSGLLLERDGRLFVRLSEKREGPDFPYWGWEHVLGIVWRLVKAKALAVASHDGTLYCSLLIDAE
jgi:hypothetical protein